MSTELSGKKILFIGPKTFNYENEIVAELERMGALVVYRNDKPSVSFLSKVLLRLFPKIVWRYSDRVFGKWLELNGPADCDVVFVIKGEGLSPKFIDCLRAKYVTAEFVFYLWDSIKNVRDVEQKFSKFDHLYSFDPKDCELHKKFKYRPLFFLERYRLSAGGAGCGCFFIGTLNGDRPAVISRLIRAFPKGVEFNYWLFVRNRIELFFRQFFDSSLKRLDPSRLILVPMSSEVISKNFQRSAAIVDVEHPNQVGLTMRTFEVLASGKKLITTNKNIRNHDFYNSNMICIIDRDSPQVDADFVNSRVEPLPQSFYEKYSLRGWILDLLECVVVKQSD